jgi:Protein of unknown function (DUF2380)
MHSPLASRHLGISILLLALIPALPTLATTSPSVKIAVFDFELEDVSAAAAASLGDSADDSTRMHAVTDEARRVLAQSGRYSIIDTKGIGAQPVKDKSLRNCDGCDAAIALKLGAERSLIGVVTRVAKTEYYVSLRITDTGTGKVLNEQSAFFTGADDAWASGVRMLLKHAVLADEK